MFDLNIDKNNQEEFKTWSSNSFNDLFPFFNDLYLNDEICYSNLDFLKTFKDKKLLLLAGGPSTNDIKWENLDYDYIISLNYFYKNPRLKEKEVKLISIGGEVDLQSDDFIKYISETNPYLFFEIHSRWFNEKEYLKKLYEEYPLIGCFHTRFYGKLGGGNRLLLFLLYLKPKVLYFAGLDGPKPMIEKNHAFEGSKNTLPYGTNEINAVKVFTEHYDAFWDYIIKLNFPTKLYNLGEGFDYNISTKFSKKYFPLTNKIKKIIKK